MTTAPPRGKSKSQHERTGRLQWRTGRADAVRQRPDGDGPAVPEDVVELAVTEVVRHGDQRHLVQRRGHQGRDEVAGRLGERGDPTLTGWATPNASRPVAGFSMQPNHRLSPIRPTHS